MGYHSEQHLLYGAPVAPVNALPGRVDSLDADKGRIVLQKRFGDEPQYRYFATDGEARQAARRLRSQWIAVVQTRRADGRWM